MNEINFFKNRKGSPQKKKLKNSLSQSLILFSFLVLSIFSMMSQTSPNVSYASPQNYLLNTPISTLAPVNSGGSVPALTYKQVSTFAGTTSGFLDATGTAAQMNGPLGMTMDTDGNVFFVDAANFRIRKMTPAGVVTTIAGDGYSFLFYGRERNNAVGLAASFSWPSGIAFDNANNCLYVADKENDVIRKVSLTGTYAVTTFAGSGTSSSLDGTGTSATFKKPTGIAIDPEGTYLYVTDRTGNKIRRITISSAQVLTIAGSGTASTVDNSTGTSATFNDPTGIAVDANFIYVSDFGGNKIRKIALTAPYAVTTFAGSGATSSVDGTGVAATFDTPFGITIDGAGNLFVTEWGNKIRKITPAGIVTTIAGSGAASSVDGNGIAATFNNPSGIVINPATGIGYVSEYAGDRIRKIELGGYGISPALPAGLSLDSSTGGISGTPTTINNGPLNYSISAYNYYGSSTATVAITTANVPTLTTTATTALTQTTTTTGGNVTVNGGSTLLERGICWSTSANPTILDTKVIDANTTTGSYTAAITGLVASTTYYIRAYATNSVGTAYGTQVSFTTLITPPTISYTASNIFTVNAPIIPIAVSSTGGTVSGLASTNVSTFAGSTQGYTNGSGTAAKFNYPFDVASDVSGTIYVSDRANTVIRKITPAGLVSTLAGGNSGISDGTGSSAQFSIPNGIATDILGNIFVADGSGIRKIDASGNVTTLLSNFYSSIPTGVSRGIVVDNLGNIYFSDTKYRIYKIDTSNNLTVLAGGDNLTGTTDGIGTSARFNNPVSLAVDATGNVYVADTFNHRIRKITPSGIVTTLAGSTLGFNDGTGASALFNNPSGITVDASGTLYVADSDNNRIRKITSMGVVTTIAGIASPGSIDGNATLASFTFPTGITSDSDGNLYIADYANHKIRKIVTSYGFSISPALPAGLVLNANGSISGTPTIATAATTYTVTATNAGGLSSFEVSIATLALPVITTTAAGSITATTLTTGGMVTSAAASVTAAGICYSTSPLPTLLDTFTTDVLNVSSFTRTIGNLTALTTYYIRAYATNNVGTSYGNQIVVNTPMYAPIISYSSPNAFIVNAPITAMEVSNIGGTVAGLGSTTVSTFAGNTQGYANGSGTNAQFYNPKQVASDVVGNLYVTDTNNHAIRKITPAGLVTTIAGGNGSGNLDGAASVAQFNTPNGITTDILGNVFVADGNNSRIRKIDTSGNVTTVVVSPSSSILFSAPKGIVLDNSGNIYFSDYYRIYKIDTSNILMVFAGGNNQTGNDDGIGTAARFYNPQGLAIDVIGNIYVADAGNHRIRKITPSGVVTTLAGSTIGNTDAIGTSAQFKSPNGITVDAFGTLYVAEISHRIRKVTSMGVVTTIAGIGTYGNIDGPATLASFNIPTGITTDADGNLYIADSSNHKIRKITTSYGFSISPALPTGLVLNADGSITGTPTVATAATNYVVTATNSGGSSSYTINFAITTIPTLTTTAASAVIATSATAGGNVTSDGFSSVTERGVCWSTSPNPTIADAKTTDNTGIGTFTSSITGLTTLTTYYLRAYATNSVGTVYGNEIVVNTPMYAPVISYSSPNAFVVNTPITALEVSNSGGVTTSTIDGNTPGVVSTLAGICGTSGATNGQGTAASFNWPTAVAVDANNNVYLSDFSNRKIRKITATGIVSDFATLTSPASPQGIAVDSNGNVYVSTSTNEIRKYIQNGTFTILAASTNFTSANGLAVDANGNVYVADRGVSKIMKISPSGVISTLAGSGNSGSDDGLAANATFITPIAVAVDASGTVYVTDYDNPRIRKITTDGIVSSLAGSSSWGFQNGTGSQARFSYLEGIAVDTFGNVYVTDSDNYAIRKITPQGVVTTLTGFSDGSCTDGSLNNAKFASPKGLTIDASGNLYVSDSSSNTIRKIALNPYTVAPALPAGLALSANGSITGTPTVATAATDYVVTATNSGGSSSYTLNFAITTIPSLTSTEASTITAITATLGGNITSDGYASVTARGVCWSTSPNPTTADNTTTDGTGSGNFVSAITGLSPVTIYYVRSYAINSVGTSYGNEFSFTTVLPLPIIQYSAATTYAVNIAITPMAVTNSGGVVVNSLAGVSTLAGDTAGYTDGTTNAQFSQPSGVVTDSNGNLFVTDSSNNAIRKITPSGTVSTFAGGTPGTANGLGTAAQFFRPNSIAIDANDNLYISDTGNHLIRKITPSGLVTTLAGTAETAGFVDGTGTSAQFNTPYGLTLDVSGNVYVADNTNNSIRKITPAGVVSTYFVVDNMLRTLDSPTAVAFDSAGNLFVSQASSNGLVKIIVYDTYSELINYGGNANLATITFDNRGTIYAAAGGYIVKAQEPYTSGSLFAGSGQGFADGALLEAKFGGIRGLTIDNEGVMYVADGVNNRIRKISPFGYSVSPALPQGLVLNPDGSITGTPTLATVATDYLVMATNSGGSASYTINLAIITVPSLTTTEASAITATSASLGGTITTDGYASVTARGVCWSTSPNPTTADNTTTDGTGSGNFVSAITGLSPVTIYYVRSYAINSVGTSYGNEFSFTTMITPPNINYSLSNTFMVNIPITPLAVNNTGGVITSTIDGDTPAVVSTLAGICGTSGATNGQGTNATLYGPNAIAVDANINVYVLDSSNHKIRKITATGIVSDFASVTGSQGIAVDTNGNVYVSTANEVRKYIQNGTFTILAASTNFTSAKGLAVDTNGNVYVADFGASKIMKISPSGVISTLAGSGDWGGTDGLAANATFFTPIAVAVDASGTVYVADYDATRIRKITTDGIVTTLAGSTWGFQNGTGSQARFDSLEGIAVDAFGNVYVSDYFNNAIRKITPQGVVTTLTGFSAGSCTDGSLNNAKFASPTGLTIDASGNLYVSDSSSNTIRKIALNPFFVIPALPAGLTLNTDGSISGTPTVLSPATNYSITATNAGGSSTTTISLAVEETLTNEPPTASNQTLCQGALVSNLVATGTSLKWYDVATGGVPLSTSTPLVSGTYYVSQTNGGVESDRTTVVVTLTTTTTWTGATSITWNTASNWSCGVVPGVSSDVIITAATFAPVISSDVAINALTLNSGTTLTVPSGYDLTVTNSITNLGTLTIENNANLIQVDNVANTGNIIVNRNSAPIVRLDHTLWSSPVTGSQTLQQFSPNTLSNRFYNYTTSSNSYTATPASSVFVAGKGFAVRAPNGQPTPMVAPFLGTAWSGTFTGIPNNGTITVALATDATNTFNYNLVGNPYPSAIDAKLLKESNPNIGSTLYFYQHTLTMNSSGLFDNGSTNYATWVYEAGNPAGGTGVGASTGNGHSPNVTPTRTIQVGQGFIVKAEGNNMTFTNSMRSGSNNTASFMKNTSFESNRLWLNLQSGSGTSISDIIVGYVTGASNDIDQGYDGLCFGNTGSYLSSKIATNDYVIQGRSLPFDSNDIVPLGFKADTAGTYSISLTNSDGIFADTQDVFLKDDLTGITHDIKASVYDFASNSGTFDARFSLIYTSDLANNSTSFTSNSVVVFKPNQWFTINTNGIIMKDVLVYDMAGRLIFQQSDINANTTVLKGLSPTNGVLLVKIVFNENEVVTVKVSN